MQWSDDGIVLSARKHGEHALVVQLLTQAHGRHAGLVRGGAGKRGRGIYQPGNRVSAEWSARLAEHLGSYRCELVHGHAAELFDDPARLAALSAACAVAERALAEREPHPVAYEGFIAFLAAFEGADWPAAYVRWELSLLGELGFGLDLSKCAATGRNDGLAYVSPKTGRAVSLSAGEPYRDRLLPLPRFLIESGDAPPDDAAVGEGLSLTGYFLERNVFVHFAGGGLPPARLRFADRWVGPRDD